MDKQLFDEYKPRAAVDFEAIITTFAFGAGLFEPQRDSRMCAVPRRALGSRFGALGSRFVPLGSRFGALENMKNENVERET